jgi:GNAT superfamily N-acetyltransferase
MSNTTIRRANLEDAARLGGLAAATFRETFGHIYPPEDLAAYLAASYTPEVMAAKIAGATSAGWLVERDGEAIGFATAGPCGLPHPEVTATCGELKQIYMLRARQGGGVGTRLIDEVLAWMGDGRFGRLWIGVWSENHGAQRLYARRGFEKVGEYGFKVGATTDHEFIMRRD